MADVIDLTIATIADALAATFVAAASVKLAQSYDELTEGIASGDCPLIQCYWQNWAMDPQAGETDRTAFQGGIRHKIYMFYIDLYAAQRGHLSENMAQIHETVEQMIVIFEQQDTKPYFDTPGIKAFSVEAERVTFEYEGGQYSYPGARFSVTIHLF